MGIPGTDEQWADLVASVQAALESGGPPAAPASSQLDAPALAQLIDHTLLKLDATEEQIDQLCKEAGQYNFKTVCVRLPFVPRAVANLEGTSVGICCVIGFHEGTYPLEAKATEATAALAAGATELDFVLNRGPLQQAQYAATAHELRALRILCPPAPTCTTKIILETSQLTPRDVVAACVLAWHAGFDFVKTSTGFEGRGASVEDVRLMRGVADVLEGREVGEGEGRKMKVKASGGIRTLEDAVKMVRAGAERLGVSAGVAIVEGVKGGGATVGGDGY